MRRVPNPVCGRNSDDLYQEWSSVNTCATLALSSLKMSVSDCSHAYNELEEHLSLARERTRSCIMQGTVHCDEETGRHRGHRVCRCAAMSGVGVSASTATTRHSVTHLSSCLATIPSLWKSNLNRFARMMSQVSQQSTKSCAYIAKHTRVCFRRSSARNVLPHTF